MSIDGSRTHRVTFTAQTDLVTFPDTDDPDETGEPDEIEIEIEIESQLPGGFKLLSVDEVVTA